MQCDRCNCELKNCMSTFEGKCTACGAIYAKELQDAHDNLASQLSVANDEIEKLGLAVVMALDLYENETIDYSKYGISQDSDIPNMYREALGEIQ